MKIRIILITIISMLVQYCISPELKVKYKESNVVDELKYPININYGYSTTDNKLLITLTNPTYTDGTVIEYDKISDFEEFKYDKFREGMIAFMFGINIPVIIGEYIYYKIKYPLTEKRSKRGFLENKGSYGTPLPLYKSTFEFINIENEISKNDDKVTVSINIDDFHDDIYNFKKNQNAKSYFIHYNICNDLKNRNYNSVEVQNCSTVLKKIEVQEILNSIAKSKTGTALVAKINATIKEEERQEKIRQQEEARQAKIQEQEEAREARAREQEYRNSGGGGGGGGCSLFRGTYSSKRACGLDCARAGYGIGSSQLTKCLTMCDRCL